MKANPSRLRVLAAVALSSSIVAGLTTQVAHSKVVTLKVWTWLADQSEGKLYKKWVAEFEKDHPNIRIKLDISGADKVLASYAAGDPIDVYRIGANLLTTYANKGLLRPIDGPMLRDANTSDLMTSVVLSGTFKGKLYGWDPHISGSTLDYNTNIFDKAGLPYPDKNYTWDDVVVAAKKTTISQPGKPPTQWGFANSESYTLLRLLSLCYNSPLFDIKTGEPRFLADGLIKAIEMVKQMTVRDGSMPVGYAQHNRTLFAEGKLAMVVEGTFMNPTYMSSKKLKYKTTWTPKGTVRGFMPWPCMWVMCKASKNPREQWEFYKFWVGKKNSMEFTDFGGPRAYGAPVWKSALTDKQYKVCDLLQAQIEQDDFAKPDAWFGFTNTDRFAAEADAMLQRIYSNKIDMRQGLDTLNKRVKTIMKYLGR